MTFKKNSAFTMIEILVVVFIIGLLATLIGPRVTKLMFKGKQSTAQATLRSLKGAISEYSMDMGNLPTQQEGLEALVKNLKNSPKWDGPYLSGKTEVPMDPWDQEFIYNRPPQHFKNYKSFEVISQGEDVSGDDQSKWLHAGE